MPLSYVVRQGDSVASLAVDCGFSPETIWEYPSNAQLHARRRDMNALMPGDEIVIPDKREKHYSCPTDRRHRFVRKGVPSIFRIQVFDQGKPRARQPYRFELNGHVSTGITDANGMLTERVPGTAREAHLYVGPDELHLIVAFGHLYPHDELIGVQQRLKNLGFDCGEPNGEWNVATWRALIAFQCLFGLQESGQMDNSTLETLRRVHDDGAEYQTQKKSLPRIL